MNFFFGNFIKTVLTCFTILVLFLCNYFRPPYFNEQESCGEITKKVNSGKGGVSSIMEFYAGNKLCEVSLSKYRSVGEKFIVRYEKIMPFVNRVQLDRPCEININKF